MGCGSSQPIDQHVESGGTDHNNTGTAQQPSRPSSSSSPSKYTATTAIAANNNNGGLLKKNTAAAASSSSVSVPSSSPPTTTVDVVTSPTAVTASTTTTTTTAVSTSTTTAVASSSSSSNNNNSSSSSNNTTPPTTTNHETSSKPTTTTSIATTTATTIDTTTTTVTTAAAVATATVSKSSILNGRRMGKSIAATAVASSPNTKPASKWGGGGGKGMRNNNNNNAANKRTTTAAKAAAVAIPQQTRMRADTWETTLTDDLHIDTTTTNNTFHNDDNDDLRPSNSMLDGTSFVSNYHSNTSAADTSIDHDPLDHHNHNHNRRQTSSSQPRIATSLITTTAITPTTVLGPVQEQWRSLWETQCQGLIDPADTVSVIHTLLNHCINQLSSVNMTLVVRKVRNCIRESLPPSTTTSSSSNNNSNNNNATPMSSSNTTATLLLNKNSSSTMVMNGGKSTSKIVAKVFSSNNNNNNNSSNGTNHNNYSNHNNNSNNSTHARDQLAMYNESRIILDRYQLLNRAILVKILPKSNVIESIIVLLLSLDVNPITSLLLERVSTAAMSASSSSSSSSSAALAAAGPEMEMDVNKKSIVTTDDTTTTPTTNGTTTDNIPNINIKKKIPKPSQIPVFLDEEPTFDLPMGTSMTSLAGLIAMATSSTSTRNQKLQLLFYCCIDHVKLKEFLLLHPAGGIPLWLLEVDQNTVVSLPSLTHYHYYGNAFLPCSKNSINNGYAITTSPSSSPSFIPSKSRTPIMVDAHHVRTIVLQTLQHAASKTKKPEGGNATNDTTTNLSTNGSTQQQSSTTTTTTAPSVTQPPPPSTRFATPLTAFGRRSISLPDVAGNPNSSSPAAGKGNHGDTANNNSSSSDPPAPTNGGKRKQNRLMKKLACISEGIIIDGYSPISTEIQDTLQHYEFLNKEYLEQYDVSDWTIQEFKHWCDIVVTDLILEVTMHQLFGVGIIPSPMIESELISQRWSEWEREYNYQLELLQRLDDENNKKDGQSMSRILSDSVASLIRTTSSSVQQEQQQNGEAIKTINRPQLNTVFGGIGGMDGLGGTGRGVLYCIPTNWWNDWTDYVGWTYIDETQIKHRRLNAIRPPSLETESLLETDPDNVIRGIMGSYEVMRKGLKHGIDYVLVPPGVWDTLYELYSGGPPLPRMVKPKESSSSFISLISDATSLTSTVKPNVLESLDKISSAPRVMKIPNSLRVETHPLILHVHICDPSQPYRRGDTGPVSVRVMSSPTQPLWRLLSEIICRFTFQTYRAFDADSRGKIRLWKKIETKDTPLPRYGPWNLLCKSRFAILPNITNGVEFEKSYDELITDWKQYADGATIESIGLEDQNNLMVEFAVLHRNGGLAWPREAAAEAGKVRRLADEDKLFRQTLLGIDDSGKALQKPPSLVGMDVDAMEFNGKWYTLKILDVQHEETDADEQDDTEIESEATDPPTRVIRKRIKVNFRDHGGHFEWIDVDSDRLQTPGRFASEANLQSPESPTNGSVANGDGRSKSGAGAKRSNSITENMVENSKSCTLPGYGACGLSNLGNSCYMNSAVQCMAYLPLLRSYLLGGLYRTNGDLNKDNPLGTGGRLLEEFAELLRSMWSAKIAEKSPTKFRLNLGKSNEQFACADQQDAQEFLNYMIDVLHEDSNRVRKKPYVEALADIWVEQTSLSRVGEESWRRFLRRNQSIMADVAMGQALNTVTCPVCSYSSRNFDPFNLLSIPIPMVADAVFQCTVIRRSTARNCPWILNKSKKGESRVSRFPEEKEVSQPPSEAFTAEQYVIALSRLADGGDLRLQLQNLSGIRADQLRLCRAESIAVNNKSEENSIANRYIKIVPLSDKEGPASQLLKTRAPNDVTPRMPTQIIAFEMSVIPRQIKLHSIHDADADDGLERSGLPSNAEVAQIEQHLEVYGDEDECRMVDTDPSVLAKAMSKSLWPRSDSEFRVGLRVDAKDHRSNWFVGSIVEVFDDEISGGDSDTGQEVAIQQKKARVHFDNFLPKWDEIYTIEHFKKGRVTSLYSNAEPKPTEFVVHHRYSDRSCGHSYLFGQSFYVQCHTEWSNARACAHIIAQASRYLRHGSREADVTRLFDKVHSSVSELIDFLIEYDREYIRRTLGLSEHNIEDEKKTPYRNPSFDSTAFIAETAKKISALLQKVPFELRLCNIEPAAGGGADETTFSFAFNVAVGNYVSTTRNAVIIHWREPSVEKKNHLQRAGAPSIMYVEPLVQLHESCSSLKDDGLNSSSGKKKIDSSEIDLEYCLTEFCKVQKLPMSDNWVCPKCNLIREGGQNMNLWRIPDLLTFHIKRFNMSARWHEKITTKVNFPMTGLDMSQWCHKESPVLNDETKDSCIYDLIGVMNHYGSLTGGHYVATCKATLCGRDGNEEVAYSFNGDGISEVEIQSSDEPTGWSLGRPKPKINQGRIDAAINSQSVADSAESMWLQFDDEVVEAIPPRQIVSEMAYVLFYRKRRITPSNIAKYSTLD